MNFSYLCGVMKIVVDDKIPYLRDTLEVVADEVVALRGSEITARDVKDADALIIRTRTRCDEALLSGSRISFVATATIGFDHIDTNYLQRAGITWTNCPGCNAASVAQYVECSLLLLKQLKGIKLREMTIGIVGCGHVGIKVRDVAQRLGMRILVCDPPLAENSHKISSLDFVSLDTIAQEADIITFHVPLTHEGRYPTLHMADETFMHHLPRVPYIINTSRGEVVDNVALLSALVDGRVKDAIIDVWEHEPHINLDLLNKAFIGTPHIAGYSADGKTNADNMVVDALCRHFSLPRPNTIMPPKLPEDFIYTGDPLQLYNPMEDSKKLKQQPKDFESLRNNYPLRREFYKA